MKKIFYYVMALALGCSQMSCSDLLDQKPQGVLTEDDLTGVLMKHRFLTCMPCFAVIILFPEIRHWLFMVCVRKMRKRVVHCLTDLQQEKCLMILNMLQVTAW